jgi:hypothetical protein
LLTGARSIVIARAKAGNIGLAREDRLRLGAFEQAQGGADHLARALVSAGGNEPGHEVAELACQRDVKAVVGRHPTLLVGCKEGVTPG